MRISDWSSDVCSSDLLCDTAMVAVLFDGKGHILDANDAAETWTPRQRRAIAARDRHCTFPSCTRPPRHCDVHHLEHRHEGGPTKTSNGALLCRFHHRLLHEYGWTLTVEDGRWTATDRHGHRWTGHPRAPAQPTAPNACSPPPPHTRPPAPP